MIGRQDVIFGNPVRVGSEVLDDLVRCIARRWPAAIVQDGATGRRFTSYGTIPFGQLSEIFVYRDESAFTSWMQLGADASNTNTMVHVIAGVSTVTLVVDDPLDPIMKSLLSEAHDMLAQHNSWGMAA